MNEFYEDLMRPIVYKWLKGHDGVLSCDKCCTLCIKSCGLHGTICFHRDNIVELSIKDEETEESVFYLHFQMHDMKSSLEQFNTFFQYLTLPVSQYHDINIHNTSVKKILLSCSGGLTSSYFAYAMQEIINERHLGIQVDAVGYTDIDYVANEYDVILLAPQIAYKLPEYKEKYGHKVMNIESIDFATSHFDGIIEKALH
ncbi:PTS sugar transporter subunit IIB [Candidatus Stoquefichus massiliensis]|uniref:PTS sugar transporter subunit IIB n=1 Tax=Candidatus Stoquefichus massiliensis TaxID=1470350 RepID=UPI00047F8BDF|nr:hypothetical protein [Candidatus Stoquefichus massiliensis]